MANIHSFWTVEGIDGSGKTNISKFIGEYLTEKGIPNVVVAAYPQNEESAFMRDAWINQRIPMPAVLSCILYLRRRVLTDTIIPALMAGQIVISDRWNDTTWVYQHFTQGIPEEVMNTLYDYHLNMDDILKAYPADKRDWLRTQIEQHFTIFLDIDLKTSRARVDQRVSGTPGDKKDAFETKPDEFFQRLIQGFKMRFRQRSYYKQGPVFTIDATRDLEAVKKSVLDIIQYIS
jgi:dTMP kinase